MCVVDQAMKVGEGTDLLPPHSSGLCLDVCRLVAEYATYGGLLQPSLRLVDALDG